MGKIRKWTKKVGRAIKKIGKKIGKAFKKIIKPFAKVFGKLGPLGSMAMMFILPGIGTAMAGWGATLAQGSTFLGQMAGTAIKFVGNAINFVATAPQKIFQTITGGISSAWNALLGRDPTGGTWLSGTGTYTDTTGLIGKEFIQAEAANAAAPNSWWGSFTNDMKNTWGNRGTVGADNLFTATSGTGGNFLDVSKIGVEANKKLAAQWSGTEGFKEDIKNLFTPAEGTSLTEATAKTTFKNPADFKTFMTEGTVDIKGKIYNLDREGVFGNIRDFVGGTGSKVGDVTIPMVGDLRDIGSVAKTGVVAVNTLAQFGVGGPDGEQGGGAGNSTYLANQQLYGGDQGKSVDPNADPWTYDYAASAFQNSTNAQNSWNTNYGLPQGFNPQHTPGWGWTYEQWLQQQMAA